MSFPGNFVFLKHLWWLLLSLNIFVHDVINLPFNEHWTEKRKYIFVELLVEALKSISCFGHKPGIDEKYFKSYADFWITKEMLGNVNQGFIEILILIHKKFFVNLLGIQ